MIYALIALALFNALVLFLGHRRNVLRSRRMPSDAYFLPRQEPVCYTPSWDRVVAARRIR